MTMTENKAFDKNMFVKPDKHIQAREAVAEYIGDVEDMKRYSNGELMEFITGKSLNTTKTMHEISRLGQKGLEYGGLTQKQAQRLNAAFEIARRMNGFETETKPFMQQPDAVVKFFGPKLRNLNKEIFCIAYLNSAKRLEGYEFISKGGTNATIVDPPEVFKKSIMNDAHGIILLHNHPSGNNNPSRADINLTNRLVEGGKLVGVQVLDHIIIADYEYTSLKSRGIIA